MAFNVSPFLFDSCCFLSLLSFYTVMQKEILCLTHNWCLVISCMIFFAFSSNLLTGANLILWFTHNWCLVIWAHMIFLLSSPAMDKLWLMEIQQTGKHHYRVLPQNISFIWSSFILYFSHHLFFINWSENIITGFCLKISFDRMFFIQLEK